MTYGKARKYVKSLMWDIVDPDEPLLFALKALDKQIPQKVIQGFFLSCPHCKRKFVYGGDGKLNYCDNCGQRFKW